MYNNQLATYANMYLIVFTWKSGCYNEKQFLCLKKPYLILLIFSIGGKLGYNNTPMLWERSEIIYLEICKQR